MTQGTLLTRCPHCDTRFRVTDEQLAIAKGKVRCGNCMEVFNALENRREDAQEPVIGTKSDTDVNNSSGGLSSEDDFVFQDNPDEDATEGAYAGTRLTFSDDELSDSFRSFDEKAPASFDADDEDNESQPVDESWAEDMLLNDDKADSQPADERHTAEEQEPPSPDIPQVSVPPAPKPELIDDDLSENLQAEPNSASNPYHALGHEPIAVRQRPSRGWLSKTVWFLVIIGLVGALVSQVVYFQFDRLSSIPELRPFYEKGCELAGCELKPLVAVDRIQSRKLVVRTAPEDRNSLIVDAVILNDAEFEQPFPAIGLTFSNLNGDVVAQSLFTPEEYLAGDARELSAMPPNTPVRIAITIRDPGRDAVNYNISFQPDGQ